MPPARANEIHAALISLRETMRQGVTPKRARTLDQYVLRWEAFCAKYTLDPTLSIYDDPVPFLQVFGHQYRDGIITGHVVKSCTVDRAVCQNLSLLGARDMR